MRRVQRDDEVLIEAVRAYCARLLGPSIRPRRVRIDLADGVETISLPIAPLPPDAPAGGERQTATHSADFRSVDWYGQAYTFTPTQAACISILWEAWEQGTPDMGQAAILDAAGSETRRLDHVFRDSAGAVHPAWGAMIAAVGRGLYRLQEPS